MGKVQEATCCETTIEVAFALTDDPRMSRDPPASSASVDAEKVGGSGVSVT